MRRLYLMFFTLAMASGQQPPTTLPSWLIPQPGANVVTHTALAGRIEVVYNTDGLPEAAVGHYQRLIVGAGLPFVPSFDGVGTSIRVAAAECDLLITIRERETGTLTRVSCAIKSTNSANSLNAVEVMTTKSTGPANSRTRTMEERIRQGEEETRRVLAQADAKHKKHIDGMKTYDQPVDGRARKKQSEK
jgi:hypothetical protein